VARSAASNRDGEGKLFVGGRLADSYPSAFGLRLRGITHLLIGGVTTEVCVQTTMREANDRGYECLLVEDATESYFPQFKASVLDMVRAQGGIVGWTGPSTAILGRYDAGGVFSTYSSAC